jgi:hypothetical protein
MGAPKGQPKSTDAELDLRITHVQDLLLKGFTRSQVLRDKVCVAWKVGERQIENYIMAARDLIREQNAIERDDNMATITANFWDLFRHARATGDTQEAHKLLNSIVKLKGLEETTINHVIGGRPLKDVPLEELDEAFSAHERH